MVILGTQDSQVGVLRLRSFQLRFRLRHRFIRTDASLVLARVEVQSVLICDYRSIKELLHGVLGAKFIIIDGEFRLDAQANVLEICRAGLRSVDIGLHRIPDAAPEIGFPGGVKGQRVVRERTDT